MLNSWTCERGVTLIELMVVISIVAVILAIGVPGLESWFTGTRVTAKAEGVLNGLQLARAEALRRNTRVYFSLAEDSGWTVGCVTPLGDANGDGVPDCPDPIQSKASDEGGSAQVAVAVTPGGASKVSFTGLGTVTANADASATISQIQFSRTGGGVTRTLRALVTSGGQSRICDPSVTTDGDPRKC